MLMSSEIEIIVDEPKQGLLIVTVKGQYCLETLELIEHHLSGAFSTNPHTLAINCSETTYIDSTGLGSLVKFYNASLKGNVKFVLLDLNKEILRIIEIAGLVKFFDIQTREQFGENYL